MKQYYVRICIPVGEEFDRSGYFATYVDAAKMANELTPIVEKLTELTNKTYSIIVHAEECANVCATCYTEMEGDGYPLWNSDYTHNVEVCEVCLDTFYEEERVAREQANREVRDRWWAKTAQRDRKSRG